MIDCLDSWVVYKGIITVISPGKHTALGLAMGFVGPAEEHLLARL